VNMSKNTRQDLLETLLQIEQGDYSQQIVLPEDVREDAKRAISLMLEVS